MDVLDTVFTYQKYISKTDFVFQMEYQGNHRTVYY